jgi:hypothetical protein
MLWLSEVSGGERKTISELDFLSLGLPTWDREPKEKEQ